MNMILQSENIKKYQKDFTNMKNNMKPNVVELFNIDENTTLDSLQNMYDCVKINIDMNNTYLKQLAQIIEDRKSDIIYQYTKNEIEKSKSKEIADDWAVALRKSFQKDSDALSEMMKEYNTYIKIDDKTGTIDLRNNTDIKFDDKTGTINLRNKTFFPWQNKYWSQTAATDKNVEYYLKSEPKTKIGTPFIYDGNINPMELPGDVLKVEETETHNIIWRADSVSFEEKPNRFNNNTDKHKAATNFVNDNVKTKKSEKQTIDDLTLSLGINVKHFADGYDCFKIVFKDKSDCSFNRFLSECETDLDFFNQHVVNLIGRDYVKKYINELDQKYYRLEKIKSYSDGFITDATILYDLNILYSTIKKCISDNIINIFESKSEHDANNILTVAKLDIDRTLKVYDDMIADGIKSTTKTLCDAKSTTKTVDSRDKVLGGPESRINPYTGKTGDLFGGLYDRVHIGMATAELIKANSFSDAYINYTNMGGDLTMDEFITKCVKDPSFNDIFIKNSFYLISKYNDFLKLGITPLYPTIRSLEDFENKCNNDLDFAAKYF